MCRTALKTRIAAAAFIVLLTTTQMGRSTAAQASADAVRNGEAAILAADRAFNQAVADGSRDRFAALIATDATFNGASPDETRGRAAIVKSWEPFFAPGGPRLSWEPTSAHVLVGGDVGVTIGSWLRRVPQRDGRTIEQRGQYLTTWRKQADGRWLVIADLGSAAP